MLHLPQAPDTLIHRPLECVTCNEQFILAEDYNGTMRTVHWRFVPDHMPNSELRYRPESEQRLVRPETRARSWQQEGAYLAWDKSQKVEIICPRCGTDNRNWLRLTTYPKKWFITWGQQFPEAKTAVLLSILFTVGLTILLFTDPLLLDKISLFERLALLGVVLAGGILTAYMPTQEWQSQRKRANQETYLPELHKQDRIPRFLWRNLGVSFILIIGIPALAFILAPLWFAALPDIVNPPNERNTIGRIDALLQALDPALIETASANQRVVLQSASYGLQTAVNQYQEPCNILLVQDAIANLTALQNGTLSVRQQQIPRIINRLNYYAVSQATYCRTDLVRTALVQLELLLALEQTNISSSEVMLSEIITQLQGIISNDVFPLGINIHEELLLALQNSRTFLLTAPRTNIEPAIQSQLGVLEAFVQQKTFGIPTSRALLANWVVFVFMACSVGTALGMVALNNYVRKINKQLPRPLYATVANMTRVVIWEARRSLEIRRNLDEIQWMAARRNELGGVTLKGVERDAPDYDPKTERFSDLIRTQRYTITSDRWGRIVSASINDNLELRSLAGPGYLAIPIPQAQPVQAKALHLQHLD